MYDCRSDTCTGSSSGVNLGSAQLSHAPGDVQNLQTSLNKSQPEDVLELNKFKIKI